MPPINRQRFVPAANDIARASRENRSSNLTFPIQDTDFGMLLMFREYQYRTSVERGFSQVESASSNVSDTIFLPLPTNIADSFQVRIQRFDQGTAGDMVSSVLSGVDADNIGLGNVAGSILRGAMRNLPGVRGDSASEMINSISSDLAFLARRGIDDLSPTAGRNVDAGTGTFINPKAALSFEGVEMKTHSFDWNLAPKNIIESENLKDIIRTINKNILPSYVNTNVVQRAMFKYPSTVDIFFVGLNQEYYLYFKTAMVQTFTTNFSSSGNAILKGGKPAAVQLQMNVIESDIHTSEDYGGESLSVDESSLTPPSITEGGIS